jgi:hypothetical protein
MHFLFSVGLLVLCANSGGLRYILLCSCGVVTVREVVACLDWVYSQTSQMQENRELECLEIALKLSMPRVTHFEDPLPPHRRAPIRSNSSFKEDDFIFSLT